VRRELHQPRVGHLARLGPRDEAAARHAPAAITHHAVGGRVHPFVHERGHDRHAIGEQQRINARVEAAVAVVDRQQDRAFGQGPYAALRCVDVIEIQHVHAARADQLEQGHQLVGGDRVVLGCYDPVVFLTDRVDDVVQRDRVEARARRAVRLRKGREAREEEGEECGGA
jgi:hypothetical protein